MTKYKITATIKREGNMPAQWTRFSAVKLTKPQCEKMLSIVKEAGVSFESKVKLVGFKCVKVAIK